MTVDPSVVPGLLFLLAEFAALAAVGYVIVRTALRETDDRVALAQGLVVGPAIWGVVVNLVMYVLPGLAGATAGWIFVLGLAAVLIWRAREPIRPRLRIAVGFALAALALFWAALASRQLLTVIDVSTHLGLAASIRAGLFPPELPWNPGSPAPYHYGAHLLSGLLTPPFGPDLAFVMELLGAYAWMSFVLVVGTALLRRGGRFSALVLTPLLLTTGAWTWPYALDIMQVPVPAGVPAAGLRASLMDIYWPSAPWPLASYLAALPNIWKPVFPLTYVLAVVVLERATRSEGRSWLSVLTLAGMAAFLGLLSSTLVPVVLILWAGLEAWRLLQLRRTDSVTGSAMLRACAGPALAALLLAGGGTFTATLTGSVPSGISLGWSGDPERWRLLGSLDRLPGGVALLGLGPLAVAGVAVLLARRDRMVLALAVGAVTLVLAAMVLRYDPAPWDIGRLAGHARNFTLLALLLALGGRLAKLRPRRRYAAGALLVALIVWPTIAAPIRNLGLAIRDGIEVANAGPGSQIDGGWFAGRYRLPGLPDRIAAYIRNHTAVDARVFSPYPDSMTYATGRPNASGFAGLVHLFAFEGPEYRDVLDYLDPAAARRLGFEYVHAPDTWVEGLPDEAVERLNDPRLFQLLVRDESESLYRVLPAFLSLDPPPTPGSYEALRRAVTASTTVYLPAPFDSSEALRVAAALSHARLLGAIGTALHLRTPWQIEPLGDHVPDLIITGAKFVPWVFPPASRQPIWRNDETAIYALDGAVEQIMPLRDEPFLFNVKLSDVRVADGRVVFTATFDDRAPDQWSGQDWLLIATDNSPYRFPTPILPDGRIPPTTMWFTGYLNPGKGTSSLAYEFDFLAPSLAVRREHGVLKPLDRSEAVLGSDSYVLAVRLRHEYKPGYWRDAAIIPVLRITVSETGEVSYQVHEDVGG